MATRLYGLLWRWHFLAGVVVFPLLFVISVTGSLYAFQPELERWLHADLLVVEPVAGAQRRGLDELAAAAARACKPTALYVRPERDRSMLATCEEDGREAYFDPYSAALIGERQVKSTLFGVVFALHWELMLGDPGRLAIEWATSWAVLLMASGVALWWPRGKRRGGGVWYPRRELKARQWLRDLHAVGGAYALPVLFLISATGLLWTIHAGDQRWHPLTEDELHDAWDHPAKSKVVAEQPRIGFDAALVRAGIALASEHRTLYTTLPDKPDDAYVFYLYDQTYESPSDQLSVWVDAYSGEVLRTADWGDRNWAGKFDSSKYAIHVGALLGLPGRIAACLAGLVLAALCVTGPWMWWKRRARGELGVPPRTRRAPWPLLAVLAAVGWLLPLVGWTLIAILVVELLRVGAAAIARRRA